jgi:hypothetical protein
VHYQWERCKERSCEPIRGATASTVTLVSADAGRGVRVVVVATVGGRLLRNASDPVTVNRR